MIHYLCIEQEQCHRATRQLLELLGSDGYDAWYENTFGPGGHKGDFAILRDAALAEVDRLTVCTCTPRDTLACPACMYMVEAEPIPY